MEDLSALSKNIEYLKLLFIGLSVIIIGFIIVSVLGSIFDGGNNNNSFLSSIVFAILFLCSTIGICTRVIIKAFISKN